MVQKNFQRATRPLITNVEQYQNIMAHMPAMLLDYLTHGSLPNPIKSMIAMQLSNGADAAGLVEVRSNMHHGYEMVGEVPTNEVWVLPLKIENHSLCAVWAVEADKYYLQDEPLRIRSILGDSNL